MEGKFRIEAYSHNIVLFGSHDFWILRAPNGDVMAELHGLATNRLTGQIEPIGTDSNIHSLRAYHFANDNSFFKTLLENDVAPKKGPYMIYNDGSIPTEKVGIVVFEGSGHEALSRWMSAVKAIPEINQQDLDYPNYGFKMDGTTVNSNSMFHTFGDIMKLPTPDFPQVVEPGWDNRTLPQERITAYEGNYDQIDNLQYPFHKDGVSLHEKIKPSDDVPYWKEVRLKEDESKFQEQIKGSRDYSNDNNFDLKEFFKNSNKNFGTNLSVNAIEIPISSRITGNETVDLLLANLNKSLDNPNGFETDILKATLETQGGQVFTASIDNQGNHAGLDAGTIEADAIDRSNSIKIV